MASTSSSCVTLGNPAAGGKRPVSDPIDDLRRMAEAADLDRRLRAYERAILEWKSAVSAPDCAACVALDVALVEILGGRE